MDFVRKLTLSWTTELFPSVPKPKILTLSRSTQITTNLPARDPHEESSSHKEKDKAESASSNKDKGAVTGIHSCSPTKKKKVAPAKRKRAVLSRAETGKDATELGQDSGTV
jgi:hypothetical protein